MDVVYTPLQFIDSIESAVSDAMGTQQAFRETPLVVNRMIQLHENAACLRLLRSKPNATELLATIEVRTVPGEDNNRAIRGMCSHVELERRIPFFFTRPEEGTCQDTLIQALESLFADVEKQAEKQPQLESEASGELDENMRLEASKDSEDDANA